MEIASFLLIMYLLFIAIMHYSTDMARGYYIYSGEYYIKNMEVRPITEEERHKYIVPTLSGGHRHAYLPHSYKGDVYHFVERQRYKAVTRYWYKNGEEISRDECITIGYRLKLCPCSEYDTIYRTHDCKRYSIEEVKAHPCYKTSEHPYDKHMQV